MIEEIGTDKRRRSDLEKDDSLSPSPGASAASHPPPFNAAGMVTQPRMDIEGEEERRGSDEEEEEDEFVEGTPPSSPPAQVAKRMRRG